MGEEAKAVDRRDFLAASAGLALTANKSLAESLGDKKPRVGLIGSGWYGKCDLFRLIQVAPVEVVSVCDVDKRMLSEAVEMIAQRQASHNKPHAYADYRVMLKEQPHDIVLIGTPDHWHALPMIAAVQSGADVYCQKPICVDIVEGQAMVAAARKHSRVVQIGTQRRSTPHLVEAHDIVREGKLGKIGLVETYCYYHMRASGNPADMPPPDYLDWEMWTGPAPLRPYNPIAHPRGWRAFMEYGNGIVGDMCVHMLDMARWMLGLGWPKSVSSTGGIVMDKGSKANISDTQTATFDYGDTQIVWQHRTWGDPNDPNYPWGATFYGDKGTLKASVMGYDFIPNKGQAVHKDVTYELEQYPEDKTERDLERHVAPAIRHHMLDFLQAIEKRGRPVADVEEGHISTATCILANLSMQLGRTLAWDGAKQRVLHDDEANRLLRRPYRTPWKHPEPDKA
jgi:predicted dehydrogenase